MSIDPSAFEPEGEEHQDRERFKITEAAQADWALRKLAQAREQIKEADELFNAEKERLDRWYDDATSGPLHDIVYFESILREWHDGLITADPDDAEAWKKEKRKTVPLPAGKLALGKTPVSIEVDDDTFIPWALDHRPDWVRTKHEPIKAEIKQAGGVDAETGEIAPGVTVMPAELRWKAVTE
jgi:hypothetical protein